MSNEEYNRILCYVIDDLIRVVSDIADDQELLAIVEECRGKPVTLLNSLVCRNIKKSDE